MLKMMLKIDLIVKIHIEKLLHAAATKFVITVSSGTSDFP
jgi:hypothetical protein